MEVENVNNKPFVYAHKIKNVLDTGDPEEDEQQVGWVKDWINCYQLGMVELTDVLSNFPDISLVVAQRVKESEITEQDLLLLPVDYKPPFFRGCTELQAHNPWIKNPMTMKVENVNIMLLKKRENVNGKPFVLTPKIKSVLDPCEYKNDDIQDDAVSLGADYEPKAGHSKGEHFTAVPIGKQQTSEKVGMSDQDNSQHPEEDEQQVGRVKDWINCYQLRMIELTDVLTNFPDVSPVLIEETIVKLVQEGTLSKAGLDRYTIMRQKNPEFDSVMEEMDGHVVANGKNARQDTGDYHMYKKTRNLLLFVCFLCLALAPSLVEGQAAVQSTLVLQWTPT